MACRVLFLLAAIDIVVALTCSLYLKMESALALCTVVRNIEKVTLYLELDVHCKDAGYLDEHPETEVFQFQQINLVTEPLVSLAINRWG